MSLWPHQLAAVNHAMACWASGHGALLAMDMGTGKTLAAIRLIEMVKAQRVLVLCPKSVRATWAAEASKWNCSLDVTVLDGSGARRVRQIEKLLAQPAIVVTNYESLLGDDLRETIERCLWDLLILDESHRVKSPSGVTSRACARLKSPRRLALTGTPMPHSPLDLWAQARALHVLELGGGLLQPIQRQGLARSFTRFRARYAITERIPGIPIPIIKGWQNKEEIAESLGRFAYQVRSADVLDLPETSDVVRPVQLGAELRPYLEMHQDLVASIGRGEVTATNALDRVLKLQQMTGGSVISDGMIVQIGTAKADSLRDLLEDLPLSEPVVVFAKFRADLDQIRRAAEALKRPAMELSGRVNQLADWKAGTAGEVLAVQIQAGGVGVDLTRARYCVYYSVGHSLGDYLQSRARVHRPGQDRAVRYFHLVATGTIDDRVYAALSKKRDIIEEVLSGIGASANPAQVAS